MYNNLINNVIQGIQIQISKRVHLHLESFIYTHCNNYISYDVVIKIFSSINRSFEQQGIEIHIELITYILEGHSTGSLEKKR